VMRRLTGRDADDIATDADAEALFKSMDANKDLSISEDEFVEVRHSEGQRVHHSIFSIPLSA
jgi:Ca2+-binding EF-hand superfamily protein